MHSSQGVADAVAARCNLQAAGSAQDELMVQPKYRDSTAPPEERIQDLRKRLTLEEKAGLMVHQAREIPRLNIPSYNWWNEALHGIAHAGIATVFPQAIGLAATFDPDLIYRIASAIGDEARAKYNLQMEKKGHTGWYQGLTFFSPNINIYRDPRWGRGQETYGEDPHLSAKMGKAFVQGLQGGDPRYLKAAACAKHFAVHSGPESQRHAFNAKVDLKDMWETYLPAFRELVEAGVEAVMGAYNMTNGYPCCAHPYLMKEVLRQRWGFQGFYVSDCGALRDIHHYQKKAANAEEAAAMALKAGCDLNCGQVYGELAQACRSGLISEEQIDISLTRLLRTWFRLGFFDPPEEVPFSRLSAETIHSASNIELAYLAALRSVTLLKNQGHVLPLRSCERITVVGDSALDPEVLYGNYHGVTSHYSTVFEGIVAAAPRDVIVDTMPVYLMKPKPAWPHWSTGDARIGNADALICVIGLHPSMEGEGRDRIDLSLPDEQLQLIEALGKTGKDLFIVVTGGGMVDLRPIERCAKSILFAYYPGEQGGRAIGDILFGKASPSGRLPFTVYGGIDDLPPFEDYRMEGRTYRYYRGRAQYPFGFGLSYSTFQYRDIDAEVISKEQTRVSFTVENLGHLPSDEVVQLYLKHIGADGRAPVHSLVAFQRIFLVPGENRRICFPLYEHQLCCVDDQGELRPPTRVGFFAGSSQPDERSRELGAPEPIACELAFPSERSA
jgi:beta-glucosidase